MPPMIFVGFNMNMNNLNVESVHFRYLLDSLIFRITCIFEISWIVFMIFYYTFWYFHLYFDSLALVTPPTILTQAKKCWATKLEDFLFFHFVVNLWNWLFCRQNRPWLLVISNLIIGHMITVKEFIIAHLF